MTDTQPANNASAQTTATASGWLSRWLFPFLRIAFLVFAAWLIWYTAGHWDRWTGAARFESTDDAFVSGDVTPLSAHVSGYITEMPVNDFQTVRKGELIAVIDPSDYQAQLDQQKAALAAIDIQEKQLTAQIHAAQAQVALAGDNLRYTRILSPADGLVGERQVRLGQFVNVGTQVIAVLPLPNIWVTANYKETQMTNIRVGQPARVTVDAFPDLKLTGHVDSWSPGTGSTFALLPPDNATGNFTKVVQRVPVKIVLDPNPSLGSLVRPGMSVEPTIDTGAPAQSGGPATSDATPPKP